MIILQLTFFTVAKEQVTIGSEQEEFLILYPQ